jgi:uncharacterized protein (TIGR03086 family)
MTDTAHTETAQRYRSVAAAFTERVEQVPAGAWDNPTPCADWVARDIVRHIVGTTDFFLGEPGSSVGPSVDDDPVGAWKATRETIEGALADPAVAGREVEGPMGKKTVEEMIGIFGVGDVLVHTWDLARATGQDESLDPAEVSRLFQFMQPMDEMMRQGNAFGPKVDVPADSDEQTKLIAFTGRTP